MNFLLSLIGWQRHMRNLDEQLELGAQLGALLEIASARRDIVFIIDGDKIRVGYADEPPADAPCWAGISGRRIDSDTVRLAIGLALPLEPKQVVA